LFASLLATRAAPAAESEDPRKERETVTFTTKDEARDLLARLGLGPRPHRSADLQGGSYH
jgi:hypothetical protein